MKPILKKLESEKIALIGLGSENYALLRFLIKHKFKGALTVYDKASAKELGARYKTLKKAKQITWRLGFPHYNEINNSSLILRSPGVFVSPALRKKLARAKIKISCPMQLFLELCPSNHTIGVTGTKGKGTTSSLIKAILEKGGKKAWLGGNIGIAPFEFIEKIKKKDWVILELSSFQLEDILQSPHIAVFTNFSPEHLAAADPHNDNYHVSLQKYWQAKLNIFAFQKKNDIAIINQSIRRPLPALASKIIRFASSDLPSQLQGEHNKENIAAAVAVAQNIGINAKAISAGILSFKGLPYRLEKITVKNGVTYYNDSLAGNPSGAMTALKAFSTPVILLAGGADKGARFNALAKLALKKTKAIVLLSGDATPKLKTALIKAGYNKKNIRLVHNMPQAIAAARAFAKPGDTILLSPACASFGLFKNYKDRGDQFNDCVRKG